MLNHLNRAGFNTTGTEPDTGEEPQDTVRIHGHNSDRYDTDPNSNRIPSPTDPPQPDYVSPWPSPV